MALIALFIALALFWLSTRQWPLLVRLGIWLAAAGLLTLAGLSSAEPNRFSLLGALGDVAQHGSQWRDAALIRSFAMNLETVAPFIRQLFDFFLVASALVGALALLAFTRGEKLERFLRPTIFGLIGFIVGSAATLSVVAMGFGGYVKPRSFAGNVVLSDVTDGDSFRIGEYALRLYGVDAPESDQICRGPGGERCGEAARRFLASQLALSTVQCEQMLSRRSNRPRDTFGRALVQCWVTPENGPRIDVAEHLIRNGYAIQFRTGGDYGYRDEESEALSAHAGLMSGCALRPEVWRNNAEARAAFERGEPPSRQLSMGSCS